MLQGEHSAILLTFIKLPFVIKIFVLSIVEWPLKTGFTVLFFLVSKNDHADRPVITAVEAKLLCRPSITIRG